MAEEKGRVDAEIVIRAATRIKSSGTHPNRDNPVKAKEWSLTELSFHPRRSHSNHFPALYGRGDNGDIEGQVMFADGEDECQQHSTASADRGPKSELSPDLCQNLPGIDAVE
jgi:hypothetical protein